MAGKIPHKKSKMGQGKRLPRGLRKYFRQFPQRRPYGIKVNDAFPAKITVSKPIPKAIDYNSLLVAKDFAPYHDCPHCGNYHHNKTSFTATNVGHKELVTCWKCGRKFRPR